MSYCRQFGQSCEELYDQDIPYRLRARRFKSILIIAPSDVVVGQAFDVTAVAVGAEGEVDESFRGAVRLVCSKMELDLPENHTFHADDRGLYVFRGVRIPGPGLGVLRAESPDRLKTGSAQCVRSHEVMPNRRLFWGDIHFHTKLSDGSNTPEHAYRSARDVFRLDFAAATDHDLCHAAQSPLGYSGQPGPDTEVYAAWPDVINNATMFYDPGRFVTFPGYEWTSAGGVPGQVPGHRNVYYRDDDVPIYPHTRHKTPRELWAALREKPGVGNALTVAHHSILPLGRPSGTDWTYHDADFDRLVEVYSQFGSSEYHGNPRPVSRQREEGSVLSALMKGHRTGMISASDTHTGMIGSNQSEVRQAYPRGLTAVSACELTRESVWEALWSRRCYGATDGERIIVDFRINDNPVGSEITTRDKPFISWELGAGSPLASIKVVRYDGELTVMNESSLEPIHRGGFEDSGFSSPALYYLKLIAGGGEMAWAGPIWVGHA